MPNEEDGAKCQWRGCDAPATPGRKLCERHSSSNPSRYKPKAKPTIEGASVLLASESKAKRKQGMEMLCDLHADEQIVRYALKEKDAAILELAENALDRPPPELIRHCLTQPSARDATLIMRFRIARWNHLYAEKTIHAVYSERRTLILEVIEGIGRAYLRSLSDLLRKYISAPLDLYYDALHLKGPKAVAGVSSVDVGGWSRDAWAAIYSVIALARLDSDLDITEVTRLLGEAERIQLELPQRRFQSVEGSGEPARQESLTETLRHRVARKVLGTRASLEWVLVDKGVHPSAENVIRLVREGAIECLPDLATTLLKKNDERSLILLAGEFPLVYFIEADFIYWPLMNWLEGNGFLVKNDYGGTTGRTKGSLYAYWRAKEQGIDPPPWWKWH